MGLLVQYRLHLGASKGRAICGGKKERAGISIPRHPYRLNRSSEGGVLVPASSAFPRGFLWGAATSSHQIEGDNVHNDWWDWEVSGKVAQGSGTACDSYHRYEEDFDLARKIHHNSHRFSIEWSRIQPQAGAWDETAVEHYQKVVDSLKKRALEPVVTLHHFTNPLWVAQRGGWENQRTVDAFCEYARRMVLALGKDVKYWVTINEPMVYVYQGCLANYWPPGKSSLVSAMKTMAHFAQAHSRVYRLIHGLYGERSWERPMVGLSHSIQDIVPHRENVFRDRLAVFLRDRLNNHLILKLAHHSPFYLPAYFFGTGGRRREMDFVGVNYYFREFITTSKSLRNWMDLTGEVCKTDERFLGAERNSMDWAIYPEGMYRVLMSLRRYGVPVMITENGVCTEDEEMRSRFIAEHLKQVLRAIRDGVRVTGYYYWSLLDNFEWSFGFGPRFGLIGVDLASKERRVKPSAIFYSRICQQNSLIAD